MTVYGCVMRFAATLLFAVTHPPQVLIFVWLDRQHHRWHRRRRMLSCSGCSRWDVEFSLKIFTKMNN